MKPCLQSCHWGSPLDPDGIDLACTLPDGHTEPWHSDGEAYWDKYQNNVADLREAVEKLIDERIQAEIIRLVKKQLL